ncbi:MAG: helix-turn-helix domain-containing protein [Bdellovibrionia bacterium]
MVRRFLKLKDDLLVAHANNYYLTHVSLLFVFAKGLRFAAALQWLALVFWTFKKAPRTYEPKVFVAFAASIAVYLLSPFPFFFGDSDWLRYLAVLLGTTPVFFLWLLAESTFDKNARPSKRHFAGLALFEAAVLATHPNLTSVKPFYSLYEPATAKWLEVPLPQLFVLPFIAIILKAIRAGRDDDMVEKRLALRMRFIKTAVFLYCYVLAVEMTAAVVPALGQVLDLSIAVGVAILGYTLDHFLRHTKFEVFENAAPPAKTARSSETPVLTGAELEKFKSLFENEKFFLKTGVGLRELSEAMKVPEYKIRRHINGELGFQNFSQFLNSYRISEAKRILKSNDSVPIYNLAIDLGYGSAVSFNRAFKEVTGFAPSAYRNSFEK